MQPRLFILINAFVHDAPNRLMLQVARHAVAEGFRVKVAALRTGGPLLREVESVTGTTLVIGMQSCWRLDAAWRLAGHIREFRPHVFHASLTRPTLIGLPTARMAAVPAAIATQHGVHEWSEGGNTAAALMPRAFRCAAAFADRIVAVSGSVESTLAAVGVPSSKLLTIPNGVDVQSFTPDLNSHRAEVLESLGFSGEVMLVGAAGNLRKIKGYELLVGAVSRLAEKYPALRLAIWGDGPQRSELQEMIQGAGLSERCRMPGTVDDMPRHIAACDLFVQPSRYESFGLAAAEAMACAVPVVAAATGGLPELVVDGITGMLVPPDDEASLARTLALLLDQPARRAAMGLAGQARIAEYFRVDQMTGRYLNLYREVIEKAAYRK